MFFKTLCFLIAGGILLLILLYIFGYSYRKIFPAEKEQGFICIYHNNKIESLNLKDIPDEECSGYQFKRSPNILYKNDFPMPASGRLQILFGKDFPGWLSHKQVKLKEHKWAYDLHNRYAESKSTKEAYRTPWLYPYMRIFDKDVEAVVFEQSFSEGQHIMRFVYSDDHKPAFSAQCSFFYTKRGRNKRCSLFFPLNNTIEARMGIDYEELEDIKNKINEIKTLLNSLIVSNQ